MECVKLPIRTGPACELRLKPISLILVGGMRPAVGGIYSLYTLMLCGRKFHCRWFFTNTKSKHFKANKFRNQSSAYVVHKTHCILNLTTNPRQWFEWIKTSQAKWRVLCTCCTIYYSFLLIFADQCLPDFYFTHVVVL